MNATLTISDRIDSLSTKLQRVSRKFATSTMVDADDLFQAMCLHLLERASLDPAFVNQTDAYLVQAGRYYVIEEEMRKAKVASKHSAEPAFEVGEDEDEDWTERISAFGLTPEEALIAKESMQVVKQAEALLAEREVEVINLICQGLSTKQIAAKFGCSMAYVSNCKRLAVKKLGIYYRYAAA